MLHAIAQLAEHDLGHVERVLRDEINADAFRADQAHDLFDRLHQRLGRIVEEQMRLVEEEDELGLVEIADLRQGLEQFRQHPQQEGRIETRRTHQFIGGKHVDHAAPVAVLAQEVVDVERGLGKEFQRTLIFQHQQLPLDRADRCRRDIAVARLQVARIVADILQQRPQILEVEEQQPLLVGNAEGNVEDAFLHIVQLQQAGQQQRPHFRNGRAHGMALLAEQVPEDHRKFIGLIGHANVGGTLHEGRLAVADHGNAGQVALHVGRKDSDARVGKSLCQNLKSHRLAGARGACDKTVTIGQRQLEILIGFAFPDEKLSGLVPGIIRHASLPFSPRLPSLTRGAIYLLIGELFSVIQQLRCTART